MESEKNYQNQIRKIKDDFLELEKVLFQTEQIVRRILIETNKNENLGEVNRHNLLQILNALTFLMTVAPEVEKAVLNNYPEFIMRTYMEARKDDVIYLY